jgi:hypothetical protein
MSHASTAKSRLCRVFAIGITSWIKKSGEFAAASKSPSVRMGYKIVSEAAGTAVGKGWGTNAESALNIVRTRWWSPIDQDLYDFNPRMMENHAHFTFQLHQDALFHRYTKRHLAQLHS